MNDMTTTTKEREEGAHFRWAFTEEEAMFQLAVQTHATVMAEALTKATAEGDGAILQLIGGAGAMALLSAVGVMQSVPSSAAAGNDRFRQAMCRWLAKQRNIDVASFEQREED